RNSPLWQARGYSWPACHDVDCDRNFRSRFGRLCVGAQYDGFGVGARLPGPRRRRVDGAGADHYRRYRFTSRARPLPRLYWRGICGVLGRRPGAGRISYRAHRLVAHFLDQPAARAYCTRHDVQRAPPSAISCAQAQPRYHRCPAYDVGVDRSSACAVLGRKTLRVGFAANWRAAPFISDPVGLVLLASCNHARTIATTDCAGKYGRSLRHTRRCVQHGHAGRHDNLCAALFRGRFASLSEPVGPRFDSADGGNSHVFHNYRTTYDAYGALQARLADWARAINPFARPIAHLSPLDPPSDPSAPPPPSTRRP